MPWRRTQDAYAIVVSEFMLQQTQVATVIPYYERWLRQFPSWATLAQAPETVVIKAWEGLGYYTRARNLHRLAQAVMERGGQLPETAVELQQLPGIGPYTAGAVASLAFGQKAALVDGNVMRVFARVWNWGEDIAQSATQREMWRVAEALLPEASDCAVHNSALMELGATVCTPRQPRCLLCPLQLICQAEEPERLPVKSRAQTVEIAEQIAVIEQEGRWWLEQSQEPGRLRGFWRFPVWSEKTMGVTKAAPVAQFTYGITKYRVRLVAVGAFWKKSVVVSGGWFTLAEMEKLTMPAAHRRLRSVIAEQSLKN